MKSPKENSFKYLATILQISGIACCSALGSKIFTFASQGIFDLLFRPNFTSFVTSTTLSIIGLVQMALGWYIMTIVDKRQQKHKESSKNDFN